MTANEIPRTLGVVTTVVMLVASNLFMTFAWYWHLRLQKPGASHWPLIAIIIVSWLIALVEEQWGGPWDWSARVSPPPYGGDEDDVEVRRRR